MPSFVGRQRWRETLLSIWQRAAVLVLVVAVLVLGGIGTSVYALAHGFSPTVGVWTQLQKTGAPPFEEDGLAAYDPQTGKQIRCYGAPYLFSGTPISTWAFDRQTCTWTRLPASGPVPTSDGLGLVYNETTGKVMRVGFSHELDEYDTWAYDASANTWTDLHPAMPPPPHGVNHRPGVVALVYDPGSAQVIMVGSTVTKVSTWAYDSRANSWKELVTNGSPPPRHQAAYAYDKSMGRLLLFGGWGHFERAEGGLLGDTWAFDSSTNTWTELEPAKSPGDRAWATMAYDDAAGRMILFGGFAGKLHADIWSYDSAQNTWTRLRTAGSPGPRGGASMFYDATLHRLVITGGHDMGPPGTPMLPDCWAFSF
jgi:hypothetical protein